MEIEQLKAFLEIAHSGSFSAAARVLGLTQPGLSRQIKQLESQLGFALIDRERRPVAVTPAGREFLSCAEEVVSRLETMIERLTASAVELSGSMDVAASTIPGEFFVPDLLARFTGLHPRVRPSLIISDSAGVAEELLTGRAEVGFLGAPPANPRLRLLPFAEDRIVLVAPRDHPFTEHGRVTLAELAGQPFVEREGGSGTLESLRQLLVQQGLQLPEHRVAMVVGSSQAQLAAIAAGMGIGFISSLALASRSQLRVGLVEIEGVSLVRTLFLAHERTRLSAVAAAFWRFVTGGEAPAG